MEFMEFMEFLSKMKIFEFANKQKCFSSFLKIKNHKQNVCFLQEKRNKNMKLV